MSTFFEIAQVFQWTYIISHAMGRQRSWEWFKWPLRSAWGWHSQPSAWRFEEANGS